MKILKSNDVICGGEGRAYAQIGDKIEELIYVKKADATITRKKVSFAVLGSRAEISRPAGWTGKGNMTVYYVTTFFRELISQYNSTGQEIYFDLHVINEEAAIEGKKQVIVLKNCSIDDLILTKLDVESAVLEENLSFTFEDFEILESFATV